MRYAPWEGLGRGRMTFSAGAQGDGVLFTGQTQLPYEPLKESWVLNKVSWLSSYPSPDSTEPLSSLGNQDTFIGKDLKDVQALFCDLSPLPRGPAPH